MFQLVQQHIHLENKAHVASTMIIIILPMLSIVSNTSLRSTECILAVVLFIAEYTFLLDWQAGVLVDLPSHTSSQEEGTQTG